MKENLSNIDWARLAAFIDGEGYIHISVRSNGATHEMGVQIGNTDARLLIWLHDTFGGNFFEVTPGKLGRSRIWRWTVSGDQAAEILKNCLPFFVMKRDQAEQAIAYQELLIRNRAGFVGKGTGRRIRREEFDARLGYANALKQVRNSAREQVLN